MTEEVLTRFRQRFTKTNYIELIEMLRDILLFDDYKVASVEGNKKNFKAVIECNIRYNTTQKTSETLRKLTPNFTSEKIAFISMYILDAIIRLIMELR